MHHDPKFAATAPAANSGNAPAEAIPFPKGQFVLRRYRVTHFRSVTDSGWLDLDKVTALIGVNESGKTNLLLPLWKLKPASGGEIQPTSDFPKALFGAVRADPGAFQFITAEFDTGDEARALADAAGIPVEGAAVVSVGRSYDGTYTISFPLHVPGADDNRQAIHRLLKEAADSISEANAPDAQTELHKGALDALRAIRSDLGGMATISANDVILMRDRVRALIPAEPPATSVAVARLRVLQKRLSERVELMQAPDPGQVPRVREAVLSRLPVFVYYSNYGNLDSEIYLPHVVENMKRKDLGAKEAAKARTLKILFGFVGLEAAEILQLGRDFGDIRDEIEARILARSGKSALMLNVFNRAHDLKNGPDAKLLAEIAEAKRTRSILLQSASTKLTERFGEWWKQGDYRFRFEADGNHFRIWVADARRPQEVELENRSTGLQWFLSFFLVFLHESEGAHRNAILLLDEPGHSLHPLAQRDLSAFFDGLAETNQIVYTTHSPFLVDADRLERARKVFVDKDGSTRATGDLGLAEGSDTAKGASFAVRAALNIAVAETLLAGARPVLVGSRTDQTYLSALKTLLVGAGRIQPKREIVFAPAAGPRVMQLMASLLAGEDAGVPPIVLDGTEAGRAQSRQLLDTSHAGHAERIVCLDEVAGMPDASIEDILGLEVIAPLVDRIERRPERLFVDVARHGRPIVAQVEDWAREEGIELNPAWRTQLSLRAQSKLLSADVKSLSADALDAWEALIRKLDAAPVETHKVGVRGLALAS